MSTAEDRARLQDDLAWAAQRALRNIFKQAGDRDEQKHAILARAVKSISGEQQWYDNPNQAVIATIRKAISVLPDAMSGRGPGQVGGNNLWRGLPERDLAEILYGYRQDQLPTRSREDGNEAVRTYNADYRPAALRLARLEGRVNESSAKRLINVIREDLADKLLALEHAALEARERSTGIETAQPESTVVRRPEYIDAIQSILGAGCMIICLWGEPGTGKTTLADQAAFAFAWNQVARLRADDRWLQDDIVDALIAEQMRPETWTESYCRAMLRRTLEGEPRSNAVIIDNVENEELIWQLVPRQPKIPTLITMRHRPANPDLQTIEIEDFTEEQAVTFVEQFFEVCDDSDVRSLARVLGCRPLALDHAAHFISEIPNITLRDLVNELAMDIADGLTAVTPPEQQERNLIQLYKIILARLGRDQDALELIDHFVAIAGKSGMEDPEAVFFFMQGNLGDSYDRLHFRAGLRVLARLGLIRERTIQRQATIEGMLTAGPGQYLVMHALTYRILRDLKASSMFDLEARYFKLLSEADHAAPEGDDTELSRGEVLARILNWEAAVTRDIAPEGCKYFRTIDSETWVAIYEEQNASGATSSYTIRYEVYPNALYKLDYRTGERTHLSREEALQLHGLATRYWQRVHPVLQRLQSIGDSDPVG